MERIDQPTQQPSPQHERPGTLPRRTPGSHL